MTDFREFRRALESALLPPQGTQRVGDWIEASAVSYEVGWCLSDLNRRILVCFFDHAVTRRKDIYESE